MRSLTSTTLALICASAPAASDCEPQWSDFGGGMNHYVSAMTTFDDGFGPALYVGGHFTHAGGTPANRIAKWDSAGWSALGSGVSGGNPHTTVFAMTVFDDGSGPALIVGGRFAFAGGKAANNIAMWDGTSWHSLETGMNDWVRALAVYDDGSGPALYAGGIFTQAGSASVNNIAKWDGESWSDVGGGVTGFFPQILALEVFDDGSGNGPALYAGGFFFTAGGVSASRIARWDGTSWSALGWGISGGYGPVSALAVFSDAAGDHLYAGGHFTLAGGQTVNNIARWNGAGWSALGSGVTNSECCEQVFALEVFDDGDGGGPALYVGGRFDDAGGSPANNIAKWRGSQWATVGGGTDGWVNGLSVLDHSHGLTSVSSLLVGGNFTSADGFTASYLAAWQGCPVEPPCAPADFNCDGSVGVADLLILLGEWGPCADCGDCPADLTGDCNVGVADLLVLLANWTP